MNWWRRFERWLNGGRYIVRCPFHHERTGSCIVDPVTETYYCIGCGKHGFMKELPEECRRSYGIK